jgi:hypothetical protein
MQTRVGKGQNPPLISILLNCPKSNSEAVGITTLQFATPNEIVRFSFLDLAILSRKQYLATPLER